jgi:hypothetical protein
MDEPVLMVDVDGVISLFGFDPQHPPAGRFEMVDGIAHFLSATAGEHLRLLARSFELVWCTGWEEKANEYLPLALGLPGKLGFLSFGSAVGPGVAHWKLSAIDAYAGADRPLAWVDDALDDRAEAWAAARPGPTRLICTDPAVGLTEAQVTDLVEWARCQADGAVEQGVEGSSEGP